MIKKKFKCTSCGKIHVIKLKEDYDKGDFMTVCPTTGQGVYVVVKK